MSKKISVKEIILHLLMMIYSWRKICLFQASGDAGFLFFYVSLAYSILFFLFIVRKKTNTIIYGIISLMTLLFLHTWAFPQDSGDIIVWFLAFPAWPILAIPYYLNDPTYFGFEVSWKIIYYLYLFINTVCWSIRIIRTEKAKEFLKKHLINNNG